MKKITILTKEFLVEEYIKNKKSTHIIAKEVGCYHSTILSWLKKYKIIVRNRSKTEDNLSVEEYQKYIIELHKTHYCIEPDCNNKICYTTWKLGEGRCRSCAAKERCKIPEENYNYKNGETLVQHYCIEPHCDSKISYWSWKDGNGRCMKCHYKWLKTFEARSKKSLFLGGSGVPYENSEYPKGFNKNLKYDIRMRDGFICQGKDCGITEKEYQIIHKKDLSLHHIDYDKHNCLYDNLITVCGSCNTMANFNKEYWLTYYQNKINVIYHNKEI